MFIYIYIGIGNKNNKNRFESYYIFEFIDITRIDRDDHGFSDSLTLVYNIA